MPKDDFIEFSFQFSFRKTSSKKEKNNTSSQGKGKASARRSVSKNKSVSISRKTKGEKKSTPKNLSINDEKCSCKCHGQEGEVRQRAPRKQFLKSLVLLFGLVILPTFIHNWDIIEPIAQLINWLRLLSK